MAGGQIEQPDMTTTINQFNQTMTGSQSQIQHLREVIQQLANGANIQNQSNQQIVIDINNIREQLQRQLSDGYAETPPSPLQPTHYPSPSLDLQLPTPTPFSGNPSELRSFQLCEYFDGSPARYHNDSSRILYTGSSLTGAARKWYEGLMDPSTNLPQPLPGPGDLPRSRRLPARSPGLTPLPRCLAPIPSPGFLPQPSDP